MATVRWRLDVAYDGGAFHGVAPQAAQRTVVGSLAEILARTLRLGEPPTIVVAGRTDAGVHAVGQVMHVDLPEEALSVDRVTAVRRSLNHQLSGDVVVWAMTPMSTHFDARRSAQWRAYRYLVAVSDEPALGPSRRVAWTVSGSLSVDCMNEVAAMLVGEHEFGSFCKRPADKESGHPMRRRVLSAQWSAVDDPAKALLGAGQLWRFDIVATSFCHQMVRSLVAALVAVGQHRLSPQEFSERLAVPNRTGLPSPAPAAGLSLMAVGYPELAGGPSGSVS